MEDTMKTPIMTKETIHVDVSEEVMSFSLKVGAVLSALIGIWGLTCLLAGIISAGPIEMIKGYLTAITGY